MEETGILLDVDYLREMSARARARARRRSRRRSTSSPASGSTSSRRSSSARSCSRSSQLPAARGRRRPRAARPTPRPSRSSPREGHELPERLLRYRELAKLKWTYVDALPRMVGADGRHPHPLQPGGGGDRPAVVVQPEPAEHPDPHRARAADPQGVLRRARAALLVVADYSQIELRVLAHIAGEPALIEAFRERRGHPPLDRGDGASASPPTW